MKTILILSILSIYTLGSVSAVSGQKPKGCQRHSDCRGDKRPFCGLPPGPAREGATLACRPCPMNRKQCKNGCDGKCGPKCASKDEKALNAPKGQAKKNDEDKSTDAEEGKGGKGPKAPKGKDGDKAKGPAAKGPGKKDKKGGDDDSCRRHLDCPRTKPFCAKKKGGKGGKPKPKNPKGKSGDKKGDDENDKPKPRPDGVCKRCNDCKRCGDGIDGTCGKKCPLIFPRKVFPLEGAKVCQRDPPKVDCEVCYNGSYMIGCTEYVCVAGEEKGKMVGVKRFEYEDKECGEKDGIANYCIDWAERR